MRGSAIVLIILMLNIVSNAQDWIEKDGIEYNCAVVRSILADYGDEPLMRQPALQGSVADYFEMKFPTCPDPVAETSTALAEIIETDDSELVVETPAQDSGDGCYPYADAIVTRDTTIKASYGFTKATVGQARVGDTFEVSGSKKYGAECWIATDAGWLFGNYVKASATTTLAGPSSSSGAITTNSQVKQESCFSYADAIVTRDTTLRLSPRVASPHDERARAGETFEVLGSTRSGKNCWVETVAGWLTDTFVKPSDPSTVADSQYRCYEGRRAYVTGTMNIRESSSANSPVVVKALAGESFSVTRSHQGDTWCWLKINKGWMADTSYVSHDIKDVLPPIMGDDWFKNRIVRAFEFLSNKSPRWFKYTVPKIQVILPDPDLESNARVIASTGKVTISSNFTMENGSDAAMIASTLIHEACHVHQWESGKRSLLGWDLEKDCYTLEANALSQIAPRHPDIEALRCWGKHYPITSLCNLDLDW